MNHQQRLRIIESNGRQSGVC